MTDKKEKKQRYGFYAWAEFGYAIIDQSRERNTMKKYRDSGFYWVRDRDYPNEWTIAQHFQDDEYNEYSYWYILGCEIGRDEDDFVEIGEPVVCPYE